MLKRAALAVFSLLFIFVMLNLVQHLPKAIAQTRQQVQSQEETNPYAVPNTNPDVPKNLHTYTQNMLIDMLSAISCQLSGIDPVNPNQNCLGIDNQTGKIGFVQNGGGAIGLTSKMIGMMFEYPIHVNSYFQYLSQNFGISKKAYAQTSGDCSGDNKGLGFCSLGPLLPVWAAFRDIAYLLFVIVFIGIGLAIMFRVKIDPRTVMTIENSLPRIVVSLVLITFSFAISGFLIDMMYVTIYTSQKIFVNVDQKIPNRDKGDNSIDHMTPAFFQSADPLSASFALAPNKGGISGYAGTIATSMRPVIQKMFNIGCTEVDSDCGVRISPLGIVRDIAGQISNWANFNPGQEPNGHPSVADWIINGASIATGGLLYTKISAMTLPTVNVQAFTFGLGGNLPAWLVQQAAGSLAAVAAYSATQFILRVVAPYLIVYIIIVFAVMWAMFRLWYELIKAYISILIDVVFAPFWMIAGAFPGEGRGVGPWLRDIIANISAFPVTIIMLLLSKIFVDAFNCNNNCTNTFFLPPLISNFHNDGSVIGAVISVGFLLLTPQVVVILKEKLKAPEFKYGAAIGQAIGVGSQTPINIGKGTLGTWSTYSHDPYDFSSPRKRRIARLWQHFLGR